MLTHRLTRGYIVLALGTLLFFARPFFAPDAGDAPIFSRAWMSSIALRPVACFAGEPVCAEPLLVIGTAFLMGMAVGLGNLRAMLIAGAFAMPPLLIYVTAYPIWIVFLMLLLIPLMAHAALNAWLPSAPRTG